MPEGTIFEHAPARQAVMSSLCERLGETGGTALILDYGHMTTGFGDKMQALRKHEFDPPLAHPGMADLTIHVDFQDLARAALASGIHLNTGLPHVKYLYVVWLLQIAASPASPQETGQTH